MPKKTIAIVPEYAETDNFCKTSKKELTINGPKPTRLMDFAKEPIPYTNFMDVFGTDVQNATNQIL